MAKRNPFRAAEDDAVEIDAEPSRKFKGSDQEPVDADTGEELFDDLNPHFNAKLDRVAAKEKQRAAREADEDENEDGEDPVDEDENEDEVIDGGKDDGAADESDDKDEDEQPAKRDRRLDRERRLREEAEDNYADLRARMDAFEEKQNLQASDSEYEVFKSAQDKKIADVRTKLAKAKEDGATEDEIRLTDELIDLRADLKAREHHRREAKESAKKRVDTPSPIVARKVAQWTRKHARYHTDGLFQDFVKSVDKQLAKQGYNPETDEYFHALDKEVRRRYPEEYKGEKASRDDNTREAPRRKKPPTANFGNAARTTPTKKGEFQRKGSKIQLTSAQAQNMRRFRLDPTNPNDVAEYVSNNL